MTFRSLSKQRHASKIFILALASAVVSSMPVTNTDEAVSESHLRPEQSQPPEVHQHDADSHTLAPCRGHSFMNDVPDISEMVGFLQHFQASARALS